MQSTTADVTSPTPTRTPAATSTPTIHTVQAGETLRVIAQRYGVTVQAIVDANDIDNPDVIHVGDQFVIPKESATTDSIDAAAENQAAPSPTRSPPTATPAPGRTTGTARVVEIVDGDTIRVEMEGQIYTVRYIGIDTPERGEPFYDKATLANYNFVSGRQITLEKDVSETDQYGRLLRYVYLPDGTFVNGWLVRHGFAQASTYPPDVAHADQFQHLQQQARSEGKGLWASDSPAELPQAVPPTEPPQQNCHSSYPTICIPPPPDLDCGDISYRRFEVVGSDPHRFDGDNDGVGCESG